MERIYTDIISQFGRGVRLYSACNVDDFSSNISKCDYGRNGVLIVVEGNYLLEVTNEFLKITDIQRDRWTNHNHFVAQDTRLCRMLKFPYNGRPLEFTLHPSLVKKFESFDDFSLRLSNPLFLYNVPSMCGDNLLKTNIALFETETIVEKKKGFFEKLPLMDFGYGV